MALRAVADHPKLARLKSLLKCGRGEAMGYLEALWHFTGRFTPQGNVGKYSDAEIEAWIEWEGDPGVLIAVLIQSHWLDPDLKHRLVVHDWHEHADDAVNSEMARKQITFTDGTIPSSRRLNETERKKYKEWVESKGLEVKTAGRPPKIQTERSLNADCLQTVCGESADSPHRKPVFPVGNAAEMPCLTGALPEPSLTGAPPEPKDISEAKASSPRRAADGGVCPVLPAIAPPFDFSDCPLPPEPIVLPPVNPEQWIYDAYPRKEGHLEAIRAIKAALRRIQKGEDVIPAIPDLREARVYLYRRVLIYARSPAGSRADKTLIPHPKTWFGQARYLDDESNWQHTGEERYENPKNIGTNNIANLTAAVRKNRDRIDANGNLSEGDAGHCDLGTLLGAIVERKR